MGYSKSFNAFNNKNRIIVWYQKAPYNLNSFKHDLLVLFVLVFTVLKAQELPPIQNYEPSEYGAENQNWAISQSSDKHIYVANSSGLLEFDGAKWQLYTSPNKSTIRSVCVIGDKIYTGCYREFGYWQKNDQYNKFYNHKQTNLSVQK